MKKILSILRSAGPALALFSVGVFFFLPYLTFGALPYSGDFTGSDLTELNLPFRYLAAEGWRDGSVPLWVDELSNGFPLLAEGQAGVFYPLNVIFVALPLVPAFTLSLLLHFFLAAWFTYHYCRVLGVTRGPAVLAGIAFAFGGTLAFRVKHVNFLNATVWLPLLFLLVEELRRHRYAWRWVVALACVFAVQFFAGHPQVSYISAASCVLYSALGVFLSFRGRAATPIIQSRRWFDHELVQWLGAWIAISIFSLGLAAIQLLPTAELAKYSARSALPTYEFSSEFALHPKHLLDFVNPYAFGNPATASYAEPLQQSGIFWESSAYIGILPLVLALLAIAMGVRSDRRVQTFIGVIGVLALVIFGRYNPLFPWLWQWVPGLRVFRFPQRFLVPAVLALTVLAGIGAQRGLDWLYRQRVFARSSQRQPRLQTGLAALLVLVVVVDLFVMVSRYWGTLPVAYLEPPQSANMLTARPGEFRIVSLGWQRSWEAAYRISDGWLSSNELIVDQREIIPPNLNALWGLQSIDDRGWAEGGQALASLTRIWQTMDAQRAASTTAVEVTDTYVKLLGLQNGRYLLATQPVNGPGLALLDTVKVPFSPSVRIYENARALPRAYPVFSAAVATSTLAAIELIVQPSFDPTQTVVLERELDLGEAGSGEGSVEITHWRDGKVTARAQLSAPGLVVFSQAWYPGWEARVDDKPVEMYRANGAFQAIEVPAGDHEITLAFVSPAFVWGRTISLISLALLLLPLLFGWWRSGRPVAGTQGNSN